MNKYFQFPFMFILGLTFCLASFSQSESRTDRINDYCDSIDKLADLQVVRKQGAGVMLDYIISGDNVVKVVERPSGYRYVSAIVTYYFVNEGPVFINADIEMSNEDADGLTLELYKIYLDGHRILKQFISERTFNADSLYNNDPDPVKTAHKIRNNAEFKILPVDPGFEKSLLQIINEYLIARTRKDNDPIFGSLYSPFI